MDVILIITNCVYILYHGFKPALFILAGFGCFQVSTFAKASPDSCCFHNVLPSIFQIGMVLETAIISFSYRKKRDEKKRLQLHFHQELHKAQVEIQEHTFKNVSEEIYGNIGQVLSLAKLNVNTIDINDSITAREKIEITGELIGKAIHDLRDLSRRLNTDIVSELGLIKSIEVELEILKKAGGFKTTFMQKGEIFQLPYQKELILFRIFQEVCNNIIKHSKALEVMVELQYFPNKFILQVNDVEEGFELLEMDKKLVKQSISGIGNIKKRNGVIGAHSSFNSVMGGGTTVIILYLCLKISSYAS